MIRLLVVDHNAVRSTDRSLYDALQQEGIAETHIIAPRKWKEWDRTYASAAVDHGAAAIPLPVFFSGKHHRVLYRGLSNTIQNIRPDIILVNAEPENFLSAQILFAKRRARSLAPVVLVSWRNIDYREVGYPYKLSSLHARIEKTVLPSIQSIIAHTSKASKIYERYGYHQCVRISPSVDCSSYSPLIAKLPQGRFGLKIGFIGRFTQLKGGDLVLQAMKHLPDYCELVMIGSGEMEQTWRKLSASLGLGKRVQWRGSLAHESIPAALRAMDILVLPSRTGRFWSEQFGRILIEAMGCGVAVVGSSSGEIPLVIGDAGLVFPEEDAQALASALKMLAEDKQHRAELIRRGIERVHARYSVESVLPSYKDLFANLTRAVT